jgi:hypothetical protein
MDLGPQTRLPPPVLLRSASYMNRHGWGTSCQTNPCMISTHVVRTYAGTCLTLLVPFASTFPILLFFALPRGISIPTPIHTRQAVLKILFAVSRNKVSFSFLVRKWHRSTPLGVGFTHWNPPSLSSWQNSAKVLRPSGGRVIGQPVPCTSAPDSCAK